ncbi:MAG TPA: hypothetical protein PKH07_04840, partial [bacterium]|nr:hypothetical protein [bacterium]
LYRDTNTFGADGVLLDGSPEANQLWDGTPFTSAAIPVADFIGNTTREKDTFVWDLRNIPSGDYYVYAKMTLGDQEKVIYNCNKVSVAKLPKFWFNHFCQLGDIYLALGEQREIGYYAEDRDSEDKINFFLDTDQNQANGVSFLIQRDVLEADAWGSLMLDGSKLPQGTYYILANVYEPGKSQPSLSVYSDFRVIIQPSEVPRIEVLTPPYTDQPPVVWGDVYDIVWAATDTDDNALIKLYYNSTDFNPATALPIQGINIAPDSNIRYPDALREDDGRGLDGIVPVEWRTWHWDISDVTPGEYYIYATIQDGTQMRSDFSNGAIIINKRPTVRMVKPSSDTSVRQGASYTLWWEAYDKDSQATINIYLDDDMDPSSFGIRVAENLTEIDGFDFHVLDTSVLDIGTYYPVAELSDGVNDPVYSYAPARLIVTLNPPPDIDILRPNLDDTLQVYSRNNFTIEWTDNDDDDAMINLYYDQLGYGFAGTRITQTSISAKTGPQTYAWDVRNLPAGKYYVYGVIVDSVTTVRRYSPGYLMINKMPSLTFIEPDGRNDQVIKGRDYTMSWAAYDPDSTAKIDLFWASGEISPVTPQFSDKVAVGLGIDEKDGVDTLAVNTAAFDATSYYPIARISDSANPDVWVVSANPVTVLENLAPSIDLLTPATGTMLIKDPSYAVTWNDQDDHNEAIIRLYYDNDQLGTTGVPLPGYYQTVDGKKFDSQNIPQSDAGNLFVWDLTTMPSGVWFVLAVISDGVNPAYATHSIGAIRVNRSPEFQFMKPNTMTERVVQNHVYKFEWIINDPDDNANVTVYLDRNTNREDGGYMLIGGPFDENIKSLDFKPDTMTPPAVYWPLARVTDDVNVEQWIYCPYPIEVLRNVPPTFDFLAPSEGEEVFAANRYYIRWQDADPDDDATIALYYDNDNYGSNGTLIQSGLTENDPGNFFLWNTAERQSGIYYLYAVVDDGFNPPVTKYSPGYLRKVNPIAVDLWLGLLAMDTAGVVYSVTPATGFQTPDLGAGSAVSFKVDSTGSYAYLLLTDGSVVKYDATQELSVLDTGIANPVDMELDVDNQTIHVLSATGEVRSFGPAPALASPYGFPLAEPRLVDLALHPSGLGAYVLEDTGVVHVASVAGATTTIPYYAGPQLGDDRSAVAIRTVSNGAYVVDRKGNLYTMGEAKIFTATPDLTDINPVVDMLVMEELGGYLLRADGQLNIFGDKMLTPGSVGAPSMKSLAWGRRYAEVSQEELIRWLVELFAQRY